MSFFDKDIVEEGNNSIAGILQNFGNKLQNELKQSLRTQVTGFTSKNLEQSIVFDITFNSGVWRFVLSMDEYGKYIDEGVQGAGGKRKTNSKFSSEQKGSIFRNNAPQSRFKFTNKKPPITNELKTWANVHGINVYALRESIFRKGIKPNRFYSDVVGEDLINELKGNLEEFGAKSIEVSLSETIEGTANG